MAVVEPPEDDNVPVVSNVLIGVPPPSRTRIKSVRVEENTQEKFIEVPPEALSM